MSWSFSASLASISTSSFPSTVHQNGLVPTGNKCMYHLFVIYTVCHAVTLGKV
uniref:Uncharacterized protein n=1 Tax=Anguilla anguilla TaxID=7936 RepID=A0A0E9X0D1_ANGAN